MTGRRKARRKGRWWRRRPLMTLLVLLVLVALGGGGLFGFVQLNATYHRSLALAQAGTTHLRAGIILLESWVSHPLSAQSVDKAQQEFSAALDDVQSISAGLGPLAGIGGLIPLYGAKLEAAVHLVNIASDVSQMGIAGCDMLKIALARLNNPLKGTGSGLTNGDLHMLVTKYHMVETTLNAAMQETSLLQPGDVSFDAHVAKLLKEFQAAMPQVREVLAEVDQALPALSSLLGISSPSHFLVEMLDSTELRPGGGFIGNYGILTLAGGRPQPLHITDVDLLDRPFAATGQMIPYPAAYVWFAQYLARQSWSLRDSNLDADFPAAARYGEINYQREGGNMPLQGVIAITPFFIEQILAITGPILVPEYHETITAQNLVDRIHYHQLRATDTGPDNIPSPDGHSSLRKRFTAYLADHVVSRIQQLPPSALSALVQAFLHAIRSKDIQLYFNSSAVEGILLRNHLAGAIEAPDSDSLVVVDANVGRDKANSLITSSVTDQVTLDTSGDAIHYVQLTYNWAINADPYGSAVYKDDVHVYVPPGSVLLSQQGWQSQGSSVQSGREVWVGFFTLVSSQKRTITLVWLSKHSAARDASGWHYQYLLQRQSGIERTLTVQVTPPSCARITGRWGGLTTGDSRIARLNETWYEDVDAGLSYTC